jgi:hypothetical protein
MQSDDGDEELDFVTREERAAAAEAAAIGGRGPDLGGAYDDVPIPDRLRPVYEAGGGDGDGFELAEHDLVRNATHDDGQALPQLDAFTPEREADLAGAEYGEADDVEHHDQ